MLGRPRSVALVLSLGLSQVAAFASSFYLLGVVGDPIARSLNTSPSTVFGLFSGSMLIAAAVTPAAGRAVERHGAKRVFVACLLLLAASLALLSWATSVAALGAALVLMGLGMSAGLYSGPNALSVEVFGDAARPSITVTSLIGGFGSTTAWMLTPRIEALIGWRGACLAWAGVLALVVIPLVWMLAPRPEPHESRRVPARKVTWDRPMLQIAGLFCGTWFIAAGLGSHLPRLLGAITAGLLGLAAVSARLFELTLLQRGHPLLTARVASLGAVSGAVLVGLLGASAAPALVVLQGLANGMLSVANGVLPLALWGKEGYALRSAVLNTPAKFAQPAAPLVLALALDYGPFPALLLTSCVSLLMFSLTFGLQMRSEGDQSASPPRSPFWR